MANVEIHEDDHSALEVTENMGNYSHFNQYKRLGYGVTDPPQPSSVARQARVDALPPPRSRGDVAAVLSDAADADYPLFCDITIATLLLDGATGRLDAWCCGNSAAGGAPPAHSWHVHIFWHDAHNTTAA